MVDISIKFNYVIIELNLVTIYFRFKRNITFHWQMSEDRELSHSCSGSHVKGATVAESADEGDASQLTLEKADIYKELRLTGYEYGSTFQGIRKANIQGIFVAHNALIVLIFFFIYFLLLFNLNL